LHNVLLKDGTAMELLKDIIWKHRWNYAFVAPMFILFLVFTLWPIAGIVQYSVYDWDGFGPRDKFMGMGNYVEVWSDPYFWNALKNSFIIAISHLFLEVPAALLVAVLLTRTYIRAKSTFRLLLFLPVITTTTVVGVIFAIILNPLGGPINELLMAWGWVKQPVNFLGSSNSAFYTLIFISQWKHFGICLIYWIASLQTVPADLYEASKMDGANSAQELLYITIPIVLPFGLIIMLLTFVHAINPFDLVQSLTGGGPNFATDVVDTYIYRYAFNTGSASARYGFSSAAGVLFAICMILLASSGAWLRRTVMSKNKQTGGTS
jgi:raffinose/stachyose/melibiose transport system permease protein